MSHQGKKLLYGIFEKLSGPVEYMPKSMPDNRLPEKFINQIKKYQPTNVQGMPESLSAMKRNISDVQQKLNDDSKWRDDIRASIDGLVQGLKEEIEARKVAIESIRRES